MNPRALRHLMRMQFEINCLWSLAIEYPALHDHPLLAFARGGTTSSEEHGLDLSSGSAPASEESSQLGRRPEHYGIALKEDKREGK